MNSEPAPTSAPYTGCEVGKGGKKKQLSEQHWLGKELEPNRKLFPDHLPFILHGVLVHAHSLCLYSSTLGNVWGLIWRWKDDTFQTWHTSVLVWTPCLMHMCVYLMVHLPIVPCLYSTLFPPRRSKQTMTRRMDDQMDGRMDDRKWCFTTSFTLLATSRLYSTISSPRRSK